MQAILGDNNIQGHVQILVAILESAEWQDIWRSLHLPLWTFREIGLTAEAPDVVVWEVCQRKQVVLLTANRNADGPDSLEHAIRTRNRADSLPVFTLADSRRFLGDRDHAGRVAERLLDYLLDIDKVRGAGRLYLP